MKKRYWWVIFTYVLMQFSSIVGIPLLEMTGQYDRYTGNTKLQMLVGHWGIISFAVALLIIVLLVKNDPDFPRHEKAAPGKTFMWMVLGVFLAYTAQIVAATIEMNLLGIEPGSDNTKALVEIAELTPWFIIVTSIIAPILEEIVFRKILFGALYKRFNFFIAAIISSLIFAAVHGEFSHLLIYTAMGLVFAFLYAHTKRIIVPIAAHVMMNTIVVLINIVFKDNLERIMREAEKMQFIFGGF
ncbi:CPBP family intramembrane metalloprotease [Ectobacillus sp. JY-23]|uniref:CPBP family intramembrane glutamic endopeptidase n=1 Tax=Ectobacillus sp. JY-23 TaxID=2933872 RepID=UPI001FF42B66|nr:CPBP family intramembrane glutamic endopeptidase [Ectobacillus sp. JY-23]UOY91570.1 CPBP family intramembrane metalloprotease [Ectobacillus sp. JY-23]